MAERIQSCLDCDLKGKICPHFSPEWWEKQGFKRNWGDAAVMLPDFEILREEKEGQVSFVILAPSLRRPVILHCTDITAWGSY